MLHLVLTILALFAVAQGESCESPQFKVLSYSTRDARLAVEAVAQLEITVQCKSGKQVGMAATTHKQLASGCTIVRLYDDDSYSTLRKARTDEAIRAVKPFGEIELNHSGVSYGPWLPSEFYAVIIFGLIWWRAYRERSKILS